jgi:hypothetical protein
MPTYDALVKTHATTLTEAFGESIEYKPAGGSAAEITAIVDRHPRKATDADDDRSVGQPIEIDVRVADVPAVTLAGEQNAAGDPGPDMVKLKRNLDDADAVWIPVTARLGQDEGLWSLAVGRAAK